MQGKQRETAELGTWKRSQEKALLGRAEIASHLILGRNLFRFVQPRGHLTENTEPGGNSDSRIGLQNYC